MEAKAFVPISGQEERGEKGAYLLEQQGFLLIEMEQRPDAQTWQKQTDEADFVLVFWEKNGDLVLQFSSKKKTVRAVDLMDYVVEDMGLIKGDASQATGGIPIALLKAYMAGREQDAYVEYVMERILEYFQDEACIDAERYAKEHEQEILQMQRYRKKKVSWAFVKTDEIAPIGTKLAIKSLENESGITITVDPDTYIMIGKRGEIYHIQKEKFHNTYEATDEPLDIFAQMLDFIPVVETVEDGKYISIDELAKLCYPKKQAMIYCKELEHRARVFSKNSDQGYFLGRPGDYLAVRCDDLSDIYVIQKDIFGETYEICEE